MDAQLMQELNDHVVDKLHEEALVEDLVRSATKILVEKQRKMAIDMLAVFHIDITAFGVHPRGSENGHMFCERWFDEYMAKLNPDGSYGRQPKRGV